MRFLFNLEPTGTSQFASRRREGKSEGMVEKGWCSDEQSEQIHSLEALSASE